MGAERHDDSGRPNRLGQTTMIVARYYSLARASWIPCVVVWAPGTEQLERVEEPVGFPSWLEAAEASRSLVRAADAERA